VSSPPIRVLIVDDEPLAREGIRLRLTDEPDVEIVGECGDGPEAVRLIRALAPDLVFLDVQMPGLDGFGVVDAVGVEAMPTVVFVTAFDRFALRAFEAHALDYLLKPLDEKRFADALSRARSRLGGTRDGRLDERLSALIEGLRGPSYLERFSVPVGHRVTFVRVDRVSWIVSEGNYARLHADGASYLVRDTMQALEGKLDPARFVRIRRSTIVRIECIQDLEPLFQGEFLVRLRDGTRLTSTRGYRDRLQHLIASGR
jgi:two-component system, LytTR family, response regulator